MAPYEYECNNCKDQGVLGRDPGCWGWIYCEDCIKGLDLALAHWSGRISSYAEGLVRWEARAPDSLFAEALRTAMKEAIQEHDRLEGVYQHKLGEMQEYELEHPFFEDGPC